MAEKAPRRRPRIVGVPEAAEETGLSESTIRGWLNRGLVPGWKLGKLWRLDLNDLEDYLERENETRRHGHSHGPDAHRSVPPHAEYMFDVDIAAQRLKEGGPPWHYVTGADEVVHLTTDYRLELGITICDAPVDGSMVSFETTLDGKQATCSRCRTRPIINELWLRASGLVPPAD